MTSTPPETSASLYLAIDQGTHASRALVFDRSGALHADASRGIRLERPEPGRAEQDAEEVVASIFSAVGEVLGALKPAARVEAAGLASQRANCVCWDRETGAALSPVFSWQDRRAADWVRTFEGQGETVHRKTGLPLSSHYGAGKLRWSLDHLPEVRAALRDGRLGWGPMASFLVHRLLEERPLLAEPQTASRTQLYNLESRDWDPDLLALFDLPPGPLPRCVGTLHPFGTLSVGDRRIPLRAVNGDQSSALFAGGTPDSATAYVNVGAGAFVQRAASHPPGHVPRLLTGIVLGEREETLYMVEGTVNGAASALDRLAAESGVPDLLARLPAWLAETGRPPLFLNGVAGLGSPFWVADFESRFVGEGTTREKAVAVVESIAFLVQANLAEMESRLPLPKEIRISGGLSRLDGLCRRLAGVTGLPVVRCGNPEATARGIAFLAAGRPEEWRPDKGLRRFLPEDDAGLRDRFRRWRRRMAEETGI